MRDPNRISRILNLIEKLWKQNPDLRLGQLIIGLTDNDRIGAKKDLFYLEDDELEIIIKNSTFWNSNDSVQK